MNRTLIAIIFTVFWNIPCVAQNQGNTWVFGDSAAIQFTNGIPMPIIGTRLFSLECSCSISDNNGDLLFYAGPNVIAYGQTFINVYNKYNAIISNGDSLFAHNSSAQGCVFLPHPSDSNKLILFSHTNMNNPIFDFKIYYSIIDVSANSDSGAVLMKNIPLPSSSVEMAEQMQVCRHGNGRDWWLISHERLNNNFYIFLIDSVGINGPFIQAIGTSFSSIAYSGSMKISPDGNKVVIVGAMGIIDLYNFDRCLGILSNWNPLGSALQQIDLKWGCSFSGNSKVLYVSDADSGLYQFDLNAVDIKASRQAIWIKPNDPDLKIGHHLIGSDRKIYIANMKPSNMTPNVFNLENMNLSVINSPDSLGAACDFQPYSYNLGGRRSFAGLPNIPDYSLGAVEPACDTTVSITEISQPKNKTLIYPNPSVDLIYFNIGVNKILHIEIFDVVGKAIKQKAIINNNEMNVSDLNQGIYIIKIVTETQEFISKFVKQ